MKTKRGTMKKKPLKPILSDQDVIQVAKKIDRLLVRVADLVRKLASSPHPNGAKLAAALREQRLSPPSQATTTIQPHLKSPGDWETGPWGIRRAKREEQEIVLRRTEYGKGQRTTHAPTLANLALWYRHGYRWWRYRGELTWRPLETQITSQETEAS
jgi:hypothetical protein